MTSTRLQKDTFIPELQLNSLPKTAIIVEEEILIDSSNLTWEFKKFEKITFESKFIISSVNIRSGLVFINCTFKKGIEFSGIETDFMISEKNPFNYTVLFNECKGTHLSFNECPDILRGVVIENDSLFDKIFFKESKISEIKIRNSKIVKLLDLSNVKSNSLRLDKNDINKNFRVESFEGDISLISNTFGDWVKFWNLKVNFSFTLNKNIFNGEFEIKASMLKGFFIHEDTFNKNLKLENRDTHGNIKSTFCDEIYITRAKFLEGAEFHGLRKKINKITLKITPRFEGVLNFIGWEIEELHISGICQNLKLLFKNIDFKFVLFNNFTNYSDLSFDKCLGSKEKPIHFLNTNLGDTRFNEYDFSSFGKIRIDNVSIDRIKASNVKWFENSQLEIGSNSTEEEKQRGIREISRQLKHALSSSGNQIDSLLFKAREMEAYRNELKSKGKSYSWKDKLIMTVNMTNNYGLNWWKPTWIIGLITLAFYIFMLPLFSGLIRYGFPTSHGDVVNSFSEFWNNLDAFWQMFNPARRFSTTYGQIDSGLLQFLDLLHRVVLGVFIYQIIRGFRRFNAK